MRIPGTRAPYVLVHVRGMAGDGDNLVFGEGPVSKVEIFVFCTPNDENGDAETEYFRIDGL